MFLPRARTAGLGERLRDVMCGIVDSPSKRARSSWSLRRRTTLEKCVRGLVSVIEAASKDSFLIMDFGLEFKTLFAALSEVLFPEFLSCLSIIDDERRDQSITTNLKSSVDPQQLRLVVS